MNLGRHDRCDRCDGEPRIGGPAFRRQLAYRLTQLQRSPPVQQADESVPGAPALIGEGRSEDRTRESNTTLQPDPTDVHRSQDDPLAQFPALTALHLTAADFKALAIQGFVGPERRGQRAYYKLRFRRGGRQVVRYVGSAARAARVNHELAILQAETQSLRDLKAIVRTAHLRLREAKRSLGPVLNAHGLVFHGLAIRRPRRRQTGHATNSGL